jgi:hypothetical protein
MLLLELRETVQEKASIILCSSIYVVSSVGMPNPTVATLDSSIIQTGIILAMSLVITPEEDVCANVTCSLRWRRVLLAFDEHPANIHNWDSIKHLLENRTRPRAASRADKVYIQDDFPLGQGYLLLAS